MADPRQNFFFNWAIPLYFLFLGTAKIFGVWYEYLFVELAPLKLLNAKQWREEAFARLWAIIGPETEEADPELVNLLSQVRGVVVDLGPGTGEQCKHYRAIAQLVNHVYFIEPSVGMHEKLHQQAESANLSDKYTIVTAGAENFLPKLREFGVGAGQVDTIISIKCLCGVPGVKEHVAADLHRLLKPGGKLLIWEHVLNHRSFLTRGYQRLLNIPWPVLLGGCHLTRQTDAIIAEQATWQFIDVKSPSEEPWFSSIPFRFGTYVK